MSDYFKIKTLLDRREGIASTGEKNKRLKEREIIL